MSLAGKMKNARRKFLAVQLVWPLSLFRSRVRLCVCLCSGKRVFLRKTRKSKPGIGSVCHTPSRSHRFQFRFRFELLVWLKTLAKTCFVLSQFVLFHLVAAALPQLASLHGHLTKSGLNSIASRMPKKQNNNM